MNIPLWHRRIRMPLQRPQFQRKRCYQQMYFLSWISSFLIYWHHRLLLSLGWWDTLPACVCHFVCSYACNGMWYEVSLGGVAVKVGDAAVGVGDAAFACSFVVCVSWIKILFFVRPSVCGTEREGGWHWGYSNVTPPTFGSFGRSLPTVHSENESSVRSEINQQ